MKKKLAIILFIVLFSAFNFIGRIFNSEDQVNKLGLMKVLKQENIDYKNIKWLNYKYQVIYDLNRAELTDFIIDIRDNVRKRTVNTMRSKKNKLYYSIYSDLFYLAAGAHKDSDRFKNGEIDVLFIDSVNIKKVAFGLLVHSIENHDFKIEVWDNGTLVITKSSQESFNYFFNSRSPHFIISFAEGNFKNLEKKDQLIDLHYYTSDSVFAKRKKVTFE